MSLCVQVYVRETILSTLLFEVSVLVVYQSESLGNLPNVWRPLRGLVLKNLMLCHIIQELSQSWRRYAFRP